MNNLLICHELLLEFNGNNSQDRQLHCSNNVSIHCLSGLHKDYEADEAEELMPSCFPLLIFDCIFMKVKSCFVPSSKKEALKDGREEY